MWEDEQNKQGGRWVINLNKQQRHLELDNFWQETVSRPCVCSLPLQKACLSRVYIYI